MIRSVLRFFIRLGVFGLVLMGVLDSSILFLPFGNDLLVVFLTARRPQLFWLYALVATAGSLLGCTITDWLSRKLGEVGIQKMVSSNRLKSVQERLKKHTFWALSLAALMPPPFPFTVFLIGASALQISRRAVLGSVAVGRAVRFSILSVLATIYGRQIIRMTRTDAVQYFVIGLAVVSIAGSAFSIAKWLRSARQGRSARTAEA